MPDVKDPDSGRLTAPDLKGVLLDGRYEVLREIGRGGIGIVYEAVHTWSQQHVALKTLLPALSLNEMHARRFLQEARSTARLAHPNIIEIMDMGRDLERGTLFLVQELLAGEDLEQRLLRTGGLSLPELVAVVEPILDALAFAHAQGVVHRDIKPSNIYLTRTASGACVPKLIDFGASKILDESPVGRITAVGRTIGTPEYMAPEQLRERPVDVRADVWAMGVVMFEAIAGRRPFVGANFVELVTEILLRPAPSLASAAPGVPAELASVVDRALASDPERRFANGRAMLDALRAGAAAITAHAQLRTRSAERRAVALDAREATTEEMQSADAEPHGAGE